MVLLACGGDSDIRVIKDREADPIQLSAFLDEAFGSVMRRFLMEHADWMHRGVGGRYVATADGRVVGYRGLIPAKCALGGVEFPGVWGVNLYVLPSFRGRGLQKLLDSRLLEAADIRMSFPGELGAKIYAKQGYGLRHDLWEWHMPFAPVSYWRGRNASLRGMARQTLAVVRAVLFLAWAKRNEPKRTTSVDAADLALMEDIYRRYLDPGCMTTVRDEAFLRWRYLEAPYSSDLTFYLTSLCGEPTHYAIVRNGASPSRSARILDLFGDFDDEEGLIDLIGAILLGAARHGLSNVSVLVSAPQLASAVRACRFFPINPYRFRWSAEDPELHSRFSKARIYWTLGDSDNDLQATAFS